MNVQTRMMGNGQAYGEGKGCQCVPDFLMSLVTGMPPAAGRMEATDRMGDFKNEKVKLGKKTCTCSFSLEADGAKCSGTAKCDKKCSGSGVVEIGMYTFSLKMKKGKGAISKCKAEAEPTPTGSGSPQPGSGAGSETGGGGMGGMGSRCACVAKGMGGSTGSGSGPGPLPPTGSGSGSGPLPPTVAPTGSGSGSGSSAGYSQAWLRGDPTTGGAHVHEGIRLEGGDGWVGVGHTLVNKRRQVIVRKVDNAGATVWTKTVGDSHKTSGQTADSVGYSIAESGSMPYVGTGLWQKQASLMKAAVLALDVATGSVAWTKILDSQAKHGAVRGLIVDGGRIICTGYVKNNQAGFLFVADEAKPAVWELDTAGNLVAEKLLSIDGLGQGAKIRKDLIGGYVMTSTAWGVIGGQDQFHVAVVKLSSSLEVEWSKLYGMAGGDSQVFDMLVDKEGNYLLGGHTTVGNGVVNWDYLALKVNSQTKAVEWRKTFGQPRGFDARYIHDEMYGVALDPSGNYLLLGGSGDEYTYTATDSNTGWKSDIWVSYLVVVDTKGTTLHEGVYGNKNGNNAGEWISVDTNTGDVMIYTDSDTAGGLGFLKLTPN